MPKEIKDIKQYIEISRRADAKSVRIKKDPKTKVTKFKARCKQNLYTLIVKDAEKAEKLKQSLAPNLKIEEISKKAPSKKR